MRILAVHPFIRGDGINPYAGGKSRAARQLSRYLVERGHKVAIFPLPELLGNHARYILAEDTVAEVLPTVVYPGIRRGITFLPPLVRMRRSREKLRSWPIAMLSLAALRQAIEGFNPDIIHNHQTISAFPNLFAALPCQRPLILTHTHGVGNILSIYDAVAFPSNFQRALICDKQLLARDHTRVIHYPVDPVFLRGEVGSRRDVLVFVGSLRERKGLDILLSAYRADPKLNTYSLHICGDGPLRGTYEAFARQHNVNATFHGKLAPEELRELLARAILMVTPSREESFGIVYQESLCCGTPFIGYPATVRELENLWRTRVGFAYDASANNPEALSTLIREALQDPILDVGHREALMKHARAHFTIERYGAEYVQCYSEVIDAKAHTTSA